MQIICLNPVRKTNKQKQVKKESKSLHGQLWDFYLQKEVIFNPKTAKL